MVNQIRMAFESICPRPLFLLLLCTSLVACGEKKKDLSPPPLNPYPKEALHVSVSFDRAEDAQRYAIVMKAHYQNQQRECGYIASYWIGNFVYPEGTFEIPNESDDPKKSLFTIYLDRYDRGACNWELASPGFRVIDKYTGRIASSDWGFPREMLAPGTEHKETCQFQADDHPQSCYGRLRMPEVPHYSRIPITTYVSEDSAPLRPQLPSFFSESNFVKPVTMMMSDSSHPSLESGTD